jgi:hypothetical protein
MKSSTMFVMGVLIVLMFAMVCRAEIKIVAEHNRNEQATGEFKFKNVPLPSQSDAGTKARFAIVDGRRDYNGGDIDKLQDGKLPAEEDQPAENFFFNAGTEGGRLVVDLGGVIEIKQVNTYSWHPNTRGPQVYDLYASDGKAGGFNAQPKKGTDPATCGWQLIAKVDTRSNQGEDGGQYGVSIWDSAGAIGRYQYLLFDISRTEETDAFGNTFYSEIDVVDPNTPAVAAASAGQIAGEVRRDVFEAEGGKYQIIIDTSETPDLTEWAKKELGPVLQQWYPKIVRMLPSEGYEAPTRVSVTFSANMQGVAATGGTRVRCAENWFRKNLQGEAKGAVVHELGHVVQNYGMGRRGNPDATRTPGWVVEGICDYIRWFLYEPETHGAEITARNIAQARYDANYRISANFLNWVTATYDKEIVRKLNAAARQGKYSEDLWKEYTGHTVQELGDEWKKDMEKKIAAEPAAAVTDASKINTLTDEERAAGWRLLFNGRDMTGWHNFKREDIRPGWQVKDGALVCADPRNAGDLCTNDQYDWFELQIEYNISEAGNSGIMYHVTNEGAAAWATGPEIQLEDNVKAADPVRCGWLYALYQPPVDPNTGKPIDATKPVGQWNRIRLLISPEKCMHEINGVKYFEYMLGSDDFKDRVAKSKFGRMPLFAKSDIGQIALQGDHGQVSFRNIKIRPIEAEKKTGWRSLFDGKTTEGWRGYKMDKMPPGWKVIDGALVRVSGGAGGKGAGGGDDIITVEQFDNFELQLEWKIVDQAGNSGIVLRASEDAVTSWHTGPEMQILDNAAYPGRSVLELAGACYDLYAPSKDASRPRGEWNAVRVVADGRHFEHWLNGVKLLEYELGSDDWNQRVAKSKFKDMKRFKEPPTKGHICLQDHTARIEFRNIKIRPIEVKK